MAELRSSDVLSKQYGDLYIQISLVNSSLLMTNNANWPNSSIQSCKFIVHDEVNRW